ncbi:MAG: transporter [Citricoccus sp.]|nr:transporter [Citricoccus sp. WCRC_4]
MTATAAPHSAPPAAPGGDAKDPRYWSRTKRSRYAWMLTFLLLFLMMLSWADKAVLGLAAVPLMEELNITPEQFGLVASAMFLTFGLAQLVAAPLANKVKAKSLLLVLCLIWSLSVVPVVVFATLPALWVSRLALGAGEGPLAPVLMHAVYKWFPAKKGATPAAVASSGVTLGIVAFAPVLAWVIADFGWRTAFVVLALVGALWCALWLVLGKEGPYTSLAVEREIEGAEVGAVVSAGPQVNEEKVPFFRSIANPTWIFAVLASFFAYWTFTLAMSWGPAYFQNVMGFSGQQAGSLIALPAAWGVIATVGLSMLIQRLDHKGVPSRRSRGWTLGLAGVGAGTALLVSTFVSSPVLAVALMSIGFGTAPAMFAITYLVVGELTTISQRGGHLNIANAVLTTGGVFAPAVAGFFIGGAATPADGYRTAFQVTAVLLALFGALALAFVDQQRQRRKLGIEL